MPRWASEFTEWARNHKAQTMGLGAVLTLALAVSVLPPRQSPSPPELVLREPAGGLLADLRGEDVLHRLETTQAAMRQEMAWLRQRLAEGSRVSSSTADLARAVSEVQVEQAELAALLRFLEAGQMRVESMVIRYHIGLEDLSERLDGLDPAGERN